MLGSRACFFATVCREEIPMRIRDLCPRSAARFDYRSTAGFDWLQKHVRVSPRSTDVNASSACTCLL